MEKWKQIKVKHHYVWEHYLKNWSVNNNVFWLTSTGKIACDSPKGLCREDGFYKISIFDDADLAYIRMWSEKSPEFLQKQHAKAIKPFIKISNMIRLARTSGIVNEEMYRTEEILLYNSLENLYCGVEMGARAAIDGLAKGDISVLDNNDINIGLYSYLGHQITRTKALKEIFLSNIRIKSHP